MLELIDPLFFGSLQFLDDQYVFTVFVVALFGATGVIARSMAFGSFAGWLAFAVIASEADDTLLTNVFYVSLLLVFLGVSFKLWRLEGGGGDI